jgi:hypothetical protein
MWTLEQHRTLRRSARVEEYAKQPLIRDSDVCLALIGGVYENGPTLREHVLAAPQPNVQPRRDPSFMVAQALVVVVRQPRRFAA